MVNKHKISPRRNEFTNAVLTFSSFKFVPSVDFSLCIYMSRSADIISSWTRGVEC